MNEGKKTENGHFLSIGMLWGVHFVDLILIFGTTVSILEKLPVPSFNSIDGIFYRNS